MNLETLLSGEVLKNGRIAKRLPLLLCVFFIMLVYIGLGYVMQNYMQLEKKLHNDYLKLQGTAVITHEKMIQGTDIDNITYLIRKYNLNITPEPVSPIIIEK